VINRERLYIKIGCYSTEAWAALEASFGWKYPGWPFRLLHRQEWMSLKWS
jgi:hypothetical protein